MSSESRIMARRQLDRRLKLRNGDDLPHPPRGWIKAIREALGMTTAQLGKRIGVSQPRVVALEKAEANKSITLDSLERAARALDCRLVYSFVPRQSLEEAVQERARLAAARRLGPTQHSMALEAQGLDAGDNRDQLELLARMLSEKSPSSLWEDE